MKNRITLKEALSKIGKDNILNNFAPYYNKMGDFISVYFNDDLSYSEYMNDFITIYRSIETKEITGIKIHNISDFLNKE